jgi:hypothetical protein
MKVSVPRCCLALVSFVVAAGVSFGAEEPAKSADPVPPSVLKRYDKNKNGALDEAERTKWQADLAARREKERADRAVMLEKYDTNKDGKLSEEERVSAKLGWQKERSEKEAEKMKERVAKAKAEREREEKAKETATQAPTEMNSGEGMMMAE